MSDFRKHKQFIKNSIEFGRRRMRLYLEAYERTGNSRYLDLIELCLDAEYSANKSLDLISLREEFED